MRANHNQVVGVFLSGGAVSYITKVLKWEQITTVVDMESILKSCFLYYKGTKMRANHNGIPVKRIYKPAVSYITKVLKWEQITTTDTLYCTYTQLFPILQRY